eukprot:SAG22_NODE_642_length_8224_cov_21.479508_2_plen_757_part_00
MQLPNPIRQREGGEEDRKVVAGRRRESPALEAQLLSALETLEALPALLERANAEGAKGGAGAATLVALLSDINEHTELVGEKQDELAKRGPRLYELSFSARKRTQKLRLASIAEGVAEIFNEVGDALFLLVLWASSATLFLLAAVTLCANVLGRLWVVARELPNVDRGERREDLQATIERALGKAEFTDEGRAASYAKGRLMAGDTLRPSKLSAFVRGALVYMFEPNLGMRLIKQTLVEREETGTMFDLDALIYVASETDAIALAARNNAVSGWAEVQTVLILITTEDMAELAIQVAYLLLMSRRGEDAEGSDLSEVNFYFWVAVVGTLTHMVKTGTEALETHSSLPRLRTIAEGREKTFAPGATDDSAVLDYTQQCGDAARAVQLAGCTEITDAAVTALGEHCSHLRSLDLKGCAHITSFGLSVVGRGCPLLVELDLDGCTALTDSGAVAIGDGCPWLTKIKLQDCSAVSDLGVTALARPRLTEVYLTNLSRVTDEGVLALARCCSSLRSLILQGLGEVTDVGVAALGASCPELRQLSLRGTRITDESLSAIGAGCGQLSMISLVDCAALTDNGLAALAHGCRLLHALSLSGCIQLSDTGMHAVAQHCEQVATIDLSDLANVGDAGVCALAAGGKLQRFYIEGTTVTDLGVLAVAESCEKLSTLNLNGCSISDDSVVALAANCPRMDRLKLVGCNALTDASATALSRCSQLIMLGIDGCDGMSEGARAALAAALPQCEIGGARLAARWLSPSSSG